MEKFKMFQPVWFKKELWIYLGMDEDGQYHLVRPQKSCFYLIEFESFWATDEEDYDNFMHSNGETLNEMRKRKGLKHKK